MRGWAIVLFAGLGVAYFLQLVPQLKEEAAQADSGCLDVCVGPDVPLAVGFVPSLFLWGIAGLLVRRFRREEDTILLWSMPVAWVPLAWFSPLAAFAALVTAWVVVGIARVAED